MAGLAVEDGHTADHRLAIHENIPLVATTSYKVEGELLHPHQDGCLGGKIHQEEDPLVIEGDLQPGGILLEVEGEKVQVGVGVDATARLSG